ncbi:MAG: branched-chain amino acid ABC transporter permease [Micromonosporaceae bacterium]|nr:branched-chain amino acid ABC transporter permease [Micromonosporaceae bacterium]
MAAVKTDALIEPTEPMPPVEQAGQAGAATGVAGRLAAYRDSPLRSRALGWGIGLAVLLGAVVLQTQLYTGQVRTVTTIFMFIGLAAAWNLIGGYAGYACFGQVGFFGLGGYTAAVLMFHLKWSFWVCLPIAAVISGLFAALVGWPLLRLRGHYFAVATLGVSQGLREIVTNGGDLTQGGTGITVPTVGADAATPWLGNDGFYVLFMLLAATVVAVGGLVGSGKFGYALRAIHQDEDAAASVGINTTSAKTAAFAISAALTGAIGAAYAFQQVTIYPERLFDVNITVLMVVMVVLGGSGTVVGPFIGAVAVAYGQEWLRANVTDSHEIVLGALIILAVILMPQGIANYARDAAVTRRFSLLDNVRRYRL